MTQITKFKVYWRGELPKLPWCRLHYPFIREIQRWVLEIFSKIYWTWYFNNWINQWLNWHFHIKVLEKVFQYNPSCKKYYHISSWLAILRFLQHLNSFFIFPFTFQKWFLNITKNVKIVKYVNISGPMSRFKNCV